AMYTVSLHDALPICSIGGGVLAHDEAPGFDETDDAGSQAPVGRLKIKRSISIQHGPDPMGMVGVGFREHGLHSRIPHQRLVDLSDRKSTRLNSSHVK